MASYRAFWWGFEVRLGHAETCELTSHENLASFLAALVALGVVTGGVATVIGATLFPLKGYIRGMNERSGEKGVTLSFTWPGAYTGTKRRGRGSSPC